MKSKKLSHFIKGKISLILIETMFSILRKLEHLEILVKLAKQKRDGKHKIVKVVKIIVGTNLPKLCIHKTNNGKMMHLSMEVHNHVVEGLVDSGVSMLVITTYVVNELGLMHQVIINEKYKIIFGIFIQAMGRLENLSMKIGDIDCKIIFNVVDINNMTC
jgi:hypothetical protein